MSLLFIYVGAKKQKIAKQKGLSSYFFLETVMIYNKHKDKQNAESEWSTSRDMS